MTRRRILSTALLASLALSNPLAAQRSATLDTAGMDRSVKPGDNFFEYANGTWLKDTEIPADRSSFGVGSILIDLTERSAPPT